METYPDSALMYTDSIVMPEKSLTKEKYMEYLVTKVQAKYKNYDDIREDTNILKQNIISIRNVIIKNTICMPISIAAAYVMKEENMKTP